MLSGAHVVIYSTNADADRAFLRDVLKLPNVDAGGGWLIFSLPASEAAVHPAAAGKSHELYLMTDDVQQFVTSMRAQGVPCDDPQTLTWGVLTRIVLPGGGALGVYEPRHPRPSTHQERLTD
jgi:hypothetical protein